MNVVVDKASAQWSEDPEVSLVARSLGSCLAIAIFDPVARIAGLLHYVLPLSHIARSKVAANPYLFGDVGIPIFFRKAYELGAVKERLVVKVAGGGGATADGEFDVGKRNHMVMRTLLTRNNIRIAAEHVGGRLNRSLGIHVGTGAVRVKVAGGQEFRL